MEVQSADGTFVILDCGTGIHDLGRDLLDSGRVPQRGHVLISHTHWDHIQGFPFFAPLFVSDGEWELYAPGFMGKKLKQILSGVMTYVYFPVSLDELGASLSYHDLGEGGFNVGSIRVTTHYLNHPTLTLGYRLETGGVAVVYVPDHEPNAIHPVDAPPGAMPLHREDRAHLDFLKDADLVIHDSQYTLEEYPSKVGWGHTPIERAVDYAIAGRVRRLALFHHDPMREDDELDRLEEMARERAGEGTHFPEVLAAAEGQTVEIEERVTVKERFSRSGPAALRPRESNTILVVENDASQVRRLTQAMMPDDFRLVSAVEGESALRIASEKRPSLVLLDLRLPGMDGLEVCRAIRSSPVGAVRDTPVVILAERELTEEDLHACYDAGATDYMTKLASPAQLRARVCAWLLRSSRS